MRATNPLEEKILGLIEPAAADLGYRIVRVRLSGLRRKRLQIMGERAEDGVMLIDDCEKLSRALSPVLEAHDPIRGEYDLEVSSPGIDRPLMRLEDFVRFAGHDAKIELAIAMDNRRRFRGTIAGVDKDWIRLALPEGGEAVFPFSQLSDARLVLTDRLIAEDLRRAKAMEEKDSGGSDGEPAEAEPVAEKPKRKAAPAKGAVRAKGVEPKGSQVAKGPQTKGPQTKGPKRKPA